MSEVSDYLKRAAKRTGLKREFFIEKNIPTEPSNILAIPFFGDQRGMFILSTFILQSFKEKNPDKYIVLISWPGMQGLFPIIDEYWTLEDENTLKALALGANNFYNNSNVCASIIKGVAEVLNIITSKDLSKYWDNGFTQKYFEDFGQISRFYPEIPSITSMSIDLKNQLNNKEGKKIVVYPSTKMRSWQRGETIQISIQKDFWITIIERLLKEGFIPVVYQNIFTYDMSPDFLDRCLYLTPKTGLEAIACIRYIGLLLDIHTGVSKLATIARCPYLAVTERQIYVSDKDYEFDDFCTANLPHQYIFSFSTQLMTGNPEDWEISVIGNIINKIKDLFKKIDNYELPSTLQSCEVLSSSIVRKIVSKRLGSHFIKSSKTK